MLGENASKWCRENLNELSAENELRTTRNGTFLVWRCRSPLDLYLSFFDRNELVQHLPIKQLGRFFFLEGRKFLSLSELVVHHLTLRELSNNPVKIINSHTSDKLEATHIALIDMDYVPGQPVFCICRGDLLAEMGRIDDRWLLVKHLPSESITFFDLAQTSILSDMDAAPQALPYFHDCTDEKQEELVQKLTDGGCGSFLIRRSRQTLGAYALLVHTGDKIDKFLIEEEIKSVPSTSSSPDHNENIFNRFSKSTADAGSKFGGWRLSGRIFRSISHIIHRYSYRPIQTKACLNHAILSADYVTDMRSSSDDSYVASSQRNAIISAEQSTSIREMQENNRTTAERILIASVSGLYKCREDKNWRSCTVTLLEHVGTAILRIVDILRGDRRTLILQHTELICLHETIFGREATVFLSPLQNESGVFLAFEPLHFFFTWFHLLRRYTVQRRVDVISPSASSPINYYAGFGVESAEMSLLSVHIDKYKGSLPKTDTQYRTVVSLNGVALANTAYQLPASGSSLVFDAHFLIILTSSLCNVQLALSTSGKVRPVAVSSMMNVPLSSMTLPSSWSSIGAEKKMSDASPATPFIVTYARQRVVVLSREAYAPLAKILLDEVLSLAEWGSGKLPVVQRNLLCSVVVSLAWPQSFRALIERTLGKNILENRGDNMLRQDSFASCLITAALRLSGKTALEARIVQERPRGDALSEEWLVGILSEVAHIPAVSLVLACIAATVAAHLQDANKEHVVRRAISAAFVLRFANPLIIHTLASSGGSTLARGVQTASNSATMHNFDRNASGEGTATRLFDLFERVRINAMQSVTIEAYDAAPEQCALMCHLLALSLSSCPTGQCIPPPADSIASGSSSSSTVTTSSGSSMLSSTVESCSGSNVSAEMEPGLSSPLSPSSSYATSYNHPELSPFLSRLLELHRS